MTIDSAIKVGLGGVLAVVGASAVIKGLKRFPKPYAKKHRRKRR